MLDTLTTPSLEDQTLEELCAVLTKTTGRPVSAKKVAAHINRRFNEDFMAGLANQYKAAKKQGERRVMRMNDRRRTAIGEVTMQIDPRVRRAIVAKFGEAALKDDGFIRDLLKNHAELRVKSRSDRLTVINPLPRSARVVRGKRGRWAL